MDPQNNIAQMEPVNEALQTALLSYETVDLTALPDANNSMSSYILGSMADLRSAVDTYNKQKSLYDRVLTDEEITSLKDNVEVNFYDVKSEIKTANKYFWNNGVYEKGQIQDIFTQYALGHYQYTQLCDGSAPVVAVENWNKTNSGKTINCQGLVTSQNDIEDMVETSFVPVSINAVQPTNSNLYFQFMSGRLNMHEVNNADDNNLDPFPTETAELGWYAPLKDEYMFSNVPWGGPTAGLLYSHTADGDFTAGSQRFLMGAVVGYKQPIYRFDLGALALVPYVTPTLTASYAQNKLNFGQGFIPDSTDTMMMGAAAQAGVELCKDNLGCISAFYEYQYDQALLGSPSYTAQGGSAGLALTVALPDLKNKNTKER